jgi:pyruvate/2-oxoglutarate dehydrogenase complex dihydrolipoamide acyltransferase (E2) component
VTKVNVKQGDKFVVGDVVAQVLVGDEIIDVKADAEGEVKEMKTFAGGLVNAGETIIEGVNPATGMQTLSSFWSAFLGTIAFSSLTMFYWLRKTSMPEWVMLAFATVLLYWPTLITDGIGIALTAAVLFMQITKNKKDKAAATPAPA